MIESTSGKQIKNLMALINKSRARNEQGLFVAEGVRILSEAPADKIDKIYVSESFINGYNKEEYYERIKSILDLKGYEVVADKIFNQITDTKTPQGIMAVLKMPTYYMEKAMEAKETCLKWLKEKAMEETDNILFLDDIRDPGNLGTIIRTAEGASFGLIVMSRGCVDIYNPKVVRATMGAIYRLPFVYIEDLAYAIEKSKAKGYRVYAAHLEGKNYYDKINYSGKVGMIIGNEANGISCLVKDSATELIKIPMAGEVESLNAAIAAGILMYEVFRQKRL